VSEGDKLGWEVDVSMSLLASKQDTIRGVPIREIVYAYIYEYMVMDVREA